MVIRKLILKTLLSIKPLFVRNNFMYINNITKNPIFYIEKITITMRNSWI